MTSTAVNRSLVPCAALLTILLAGCATIFKGAKQTIDFTSEPSTADVYVNGQLMGKTPMQIELKVDKTYNVEFRKEGFENRTIILSHSIGAHWIIFDVLFGLIPVIIDASTGAWYSLDLDHVRGALVPKS